MNSPIRQSQTEPAHLIAKPDYRPITWENRFICVALTWLSRRDFFVRQAPKKSKNLDNSQSALGRGRPNAMRIGAQRRGGRSSCPRGSPPGAMPACSTQHGL